MLGCGLWGVDCGVWVADGDRAGGTAEKPAGLRGALGALGAAAGKFRYPGDPEEPTVEEVRDALGIGGRVYEAVLDLVPGGRKSGSSAGIVLHGREFGRVRTKSSRKMGAFLLWRGRDGWRLRGRREGWRGGVVGSGREEGSRMSVTVELGLELQARLGKGHD